MADERPIPEARERLEQIQEKLDELTRELEQAAKDLEQKGSLPEAMSAPKDFDNESPIPGLG
jgi:hypothetical protein